MSTVSETLVAQPAPVLTLRPQSSAVPKEETEGYKYTHLLPTFSSDRYPPLEPFEHVDPGQRALSHPDPRSFLRNATNVFEIQPVLGTEVEGLQLTQLTNDERDQIALLVRVLAICRYLSSKSLTKL